MQVNSSRKAMSRPFVLALAEAIDRAAHDVCTAPEAHAHYGEQPPTAWDNWVSWCRGFVAGLVGDSEAIPLAERIKNFVIAERKPWPRRKESEGHDQ